MLHLRKSLAPHVRLLLDALASPTSCAALDASSWDQLVRTARAARLLGTLAARVEAAGVADRIDQAVAGHLRAAMAESHYLRQMSLRQLTLIADKLRTLEAPVLALKGSAYILSGLPCAVGRLPRDVDLMVERRWLDDVESALLAAGWVFSKTDDYDQQYYRQWTHELPPMRAPTLPLELDLHHSILPPIGRLRPDAARLIEDSVPIPGSRFRVLRPADQVLHAAVHLFQDSDCVGKLRDLVDIDGLIRHFAAQDGGFWGELGESASVHGLGRPLWYALAFCTAWLETPVPPSFLIETQEYRPQALSRWSMTASITRVLPPVHPDLEPSLDDRVAASVLEFRALWLRMPPWTLAYHGLSKLVRSMRRSDAGTSAR